MSRATYRICRSCGDMHEVSAWPSDCLEQFRKARSDLPMPAIRADGMSPIMNHANGLIYDSRSAYERGVKDAGCEIVGNEKLTPKPPPEPSLRDIKRDVKTAMDQVEARL